MTDMTTIELVEPDHYEIVVLFASSVARKYRVIAESPKEAIDLIESNVKVADDTVKQVMFSRHVQKTTRTYVTGFVPDDQP